MVLLPTPQFAVEEGEEGEIFRVRRYASMMAVATTGVVRVSGTAEILQ